MAGFMSSLDLFALPSVWEGLPHVVMEAMACGCPVVAARVGGVSELIAEGVTGITVQPQCPKALAEGIVALLEDDRARLGMGRKAHEVAQRDFDFMKMVRQTEELYLSLMERRGVCVRS
jgi:glycosyltransferase involved in cell wall biosynthesis